MTHRGPCQPRPFCDSVNPSETQGQAAPPASCPHPSSQTWVSTAAPRNPLGKRGRGGEAFAASLARHSQRSRHVTKPRCGAAGENEELGASDADSRRSLLRARNRRFLFTEKTLITARSWGGEGGEAAHEMRILSSRRDRSQHTRSSRSHTLLGHSGQPEHGDPSALAQGKEPSLLGFSNPDPAAEQTREPSRPREKGIQPLFPSRGSKARRGKGNTETPLEIPNH